MEKEKHHKEKKSIAKREKDTAENSRKQVELAVPILKEFRLFYLAWFGLIW